MATEWMIFPDDQGDDLEAVALSPSALSEHYHESFAEDIGADDEYGLFEFSHADIPETYVQNASDPWDSRFKVDQLPGNVSEDDVAQQLEDAGYSKQHERGELEVYRGEDGFHAVGDNRHVVVLGSQNASTSQQRDLMFRVLEETNDDRYELPEFMQDGLDSISVQDSLSLHMNPVIGYMHSVDSDEYQPKMGISSVDFESGEKYGAWPFENAQTAENAMTILQAHDGEYNDGFEEPRLDGTVITASGADYQLEEMNANRNFMMSSPVI